jgi:hypothetical protein
MTDLRNLREKGGRKGIFRRGLAKRSLLLFALDSSAAKPDPRAADFTCASAVFGCSLTTRERLGLVCLKDSNHAQLVSADRERI